MNVLRLLSLAVAIIGVAEFSHAQSMQPAVFVTNNVSDEITSFTVNNDGSLNRIGNFVTGEGPQAISLSPDGQYLAVGHGTISPTTEELRIFRVNSDATLSHLITRLVPDSPLDVQWNSDRILTVAHTDVPSSVILFDYDGAANTLSQVDIEGSGDFTTSLDIARDGSLLFAQASFSNRISSFGVDASGDATLIDAHSMGSNFAVAIKATNDGNFLYGAGGISGDDRRIFGYSVDANGQIDDLPAGSYTSPGISPKVLGVTADDQVLVAGHGNDSTIRSFLRDTITGDLTATPHVFDVGSQGTLGDLQVMGDLMFVTDESTVNDGVKGLYSFRINADGSFTQLGPLVDTLGTRPEYIAAWEGLATTLACDFDGNTTCDLVDLNALLAEGPIAPGVPVTVGVNDHLDINQDGVLDLNDRDQWLTEAATENGLASPYKLGDADLNGTVDAADFIAWNDNKFSATLQWDNGDFTGDGFNDASDFVAWNANKFTSSDVVVGVPEPATFTIVWLTLLAVRARRRR